MNPFENFPEKFQNIFLFPCSFWNSKKRIFDIDTVLECFFF